MLIREDLWLADVLSIEHRAHVSFPRSTIYSRRNVSVPIGPSWLFPLHAVFIINSVNSVCRSTQLASFENNHALRNQTLHKGGMGLSVLSTCLSEAPNQVRLEHRSSGSTTVNKSKTAGNYDEIFNALLCLSILLVTRIRVYRKTDTVSQNRNMTF